MLPASCPFVVSRLIQMTKLGRRWAIFNALNTDAGKPIADARRSYCRRYDNLVDVHNIERRCHVPTLTVKTNAAIFSCICSPRVCARACACERACMRVCVRACFDVVSAVVSIDIVVVVFVVLFSRRREEPAACCSLHAKPVGRMLANFSKRNGQAPPNRRPPNAFFIETASCNVRNSYTQQLCVIKPPDIAAPYYCRV